MNSRPEGKIKQLEEKISMLIEDSVLSSCKGNYKKALDHAKEAQQKEKSLLKLREQAGVAESHDWDISFSVTLRYFFFSFLAYSLLIMILKLISSNYVVLLLLVDASRCFSI